MQLESVTLTNVGLVRAMNQDSVMEIPQFGVYVVADGMGGEKAGEEASAQVVETLREKFAAFFEKAPTGPSQIEGEMRDSLLKANRDVFQISVREPEKRGLGSTASLLCLHRGVYFCAQVGDSRVYLMRDGNVQQITRDHTLVWALYEQGAISRDQLETHPDRHLLTQCIGNERPVKVDTFMGQTQVGDMFLVCSDGLTGYAKEQKVFEILKLSELSLEERANRLVQAALDAGGGDNVSVILVRVDSLGDQDQWEPEETAPPAKFGDSDDVEAFATSIRQPIEMLEGAEGDGAADPAAIADPGARTRRILLVVLAVLTGVMAIVWLTVGSGKVRVYVEAGRETPPEIQVLARQGDRTIEAQSIRRDANGMFLELPAGGSWDLILKADGYVPRMLKMDIPSGSKLAVHPALEWQRQPVLTLRMPSTPLPNRVSLLLQGDDGGANDIVFEADRLPGAGGKLEVPILPNATYTVVAETDGRANFVSPPQQLSPGQKRDLMIYFVADEAPATTSGLNATHP